MKAVASSQWIRRVQIAATCTIVTGCASTAPEFASVREPHSSYLGIHVKAPGIEGWKVTEKRYKAGWRIMYRYEDPNDPSRTQFLLLKADRYEPGGFAKAHGSLQELANSVLKESQESSKDERFEEKWAETVREDFQGLETHRMRIAWEERRNPHYPDTVLLLEVVQPHFLHPQDPDEIIMVSASTRRPLDKQGFSPDSLVTSFLESMSFGE
jgi:hypothetical protein